MVHLLLKKSTAGFYFLYKKFRVIEDLLRSHLLVRKPMSIAARLSATPK